MRAGLFFTSLLLAGTHLEAQRIGDNLRLWVGGSTEWQYGVVVNRDSTRLHVRHPSAEVAYRIAELERIEVWRRQNVGVALLVGALATMAGYALGDALDGDSRRMTGSRGGDLALAGGIGALVSAICVGKNPGYWRPVSR
jgi:hypothetical protein